MNAMCQAPSQPPLDPLGTPHVLDVLSCTQSCGDCRTFLAVGDRTSPRWLLPTTYSHRTILDSFVPSYSAAHYLIKTVWKLGLPLPRGGVTRLQSHVLQSLEDRVSDIINARLQLLGLYIGTPGAFQKATAFFTDETGAAPVLVKIAPSGPAAKALAHEHQVLSELSYLQPSLPEAFAIFDWHGFTLMATSTAPEGRSITQFTPSHASFLENLTISTAELSRFNEGPMWCDMNRIFEEIRSFLPNIWIQRYEQALYALDKHLGRLVIPHTRAHRDFTPWNIRLSRKGLYVFDWEFSKPGMIPLYDAFHFQFMTDTLLRRKSMQVGKLVKWVSTTLSIEQTKSNGLTPATPYLLLAYLIDIGLFYHKALQLRNGTEDDKVLKQVGHLLDKFMVEV